VAVLQILGKAEFLNPGGSVKDRVALRILQEALVSSAHCSHFSVNSLMLISLPSSGPAAAGLCALCSLWAQAVIKLRVDCHAWLSLMEQLHPNCLSNIMP
jgi:cysteine synthase